MPTSIVAENGELLSSAPVPRFDPNSVFLFVGVVFCVAFVGLGGPGGFLGAPGGWSLNLSSRSGVPPLLLSLKSSPGAPKPPPGPPKPTENNTKKTMFRSNP